MQILKSIVNDDIMNEFPEIRGRSLMNHAFNSCNIENTLSIASVFCPEIIEDDGYIFISEFYNGGIKELKKQFNEDRKQIEMFVNSWSLAEFFNQPDDMLVHNDKVIESFGTILKHFWDLRFKELFPNREIVVELDDGIMGENGLTITVYQK